MGIEDVVNGKVEETPVVETPEIEAPAVEAAPVVETPEAETPEVAPAVEPAKEDKTVPLAVALDWRDERNRYKAEAEALRKPAEPAKAPDPYDDPKGFEAHIDQRIEARTTANRFQLSEVIAKREYGEETVKTATEWALERAKTDPGFAHKYMADAHPIDWIVRQHKEAADLELYRTDPIAFANKVLAEKGQVASPVPVIVAGEQQQAPVTPPRSLASQPSKNGGVADVPTGPLAAVTALFEGR